MRWLLAAMLVLSGCQKTDPAAEAMRGFKFHLGEPVPASLRQLRTGHVTDVDPTCLLAFECSATDMRTLIQRNHFVAPPPVAPPEHLLPAGWELRSLGTAPVSLGRENPRAAEFLFVSPEQTQAYYAYWAY